MWQTFLYRYKGSRGGVITFTRHFLSTVCCHPPPLPKKRSTPFQPEGLRGKNQKQLHYDLLFWKKGRELGLNRWPSYGAWPKVWTTSQVTSGLFHHWGLYYSMIVGGGGEGGLTTSIQSNFLFSSACQPSQFSSVFSNNFPHQSSTL